MWKAYVCIKKQNKEAMSCLVKGGKQKSLKEVERELKFKEWFNLKGIRAEIKRCSLVN